MSEENDAVCIAYVHSNEVAHSWHQSLMELVAWDFANHGRVIRGGWLAMKYGTGGIIAARNQTVEKFLNQRDAEWLMWFDTDMGFQPDTVDRLIEMADPVERPIIGGLCFAQRETALDGMGGYRCQPRPTILDWISDTKGFQGRAYWPVNQVVQCGATGSACILIHRSALEKMAEKYGSGTWYDRVPNPAQGGLYGEDVSFCIRAGAMEIPTFVHTGVKTTHMKSLWLQEADYWRYAQAPPATEPVAVVVPVLGRPQNAQPFMASLRASTGMATVYAVAGPENTAEAHQATVAAWKAAGAQVLTGPGVTFAEKVNEGYQQTVGPWVFIVGDDVRFHPGWLDHAEAVAGKDHHVIGTNDLGNPRVTSGEHATHLLIRRSYIDEIGASWDSPGILAHEGYRHWFVDDEIVTAAKQRGCWAMALGSVVEHLHPAWKKGPMDEVYELGMKHSAKDQELFEQRFKENVRGKDAGRG
jgi:hypothetical protein